ncbi:RNA polymerase sigma factor (sigma-70 family) [Mumia flava]|uniref:RNA polymerase sigma factor (Sigma-70 family) n=1 Tax=Mumia flava TaxID=1348852 RepID=A0A0B2BMC7_9ACTN|nr:sigma-70 family RNA polymerase sigma factor [Mumia flava]PJJ54289.1 RNA polymerase sigma factor (sigma-70 family) [Mumia flava]
MTVDDDAEGPWRELAPRALAGLVRRYGGDQFEACEDAVQDALVEAHRRWASQPPDDPAGWLSTVARRRYVDRVRSDRRRRDRESREAMLRVPVAAPGGASDDSLLLLQLCCHPALTRTAQVTLTLRAVAGLTTQQIANVYQVPVASVAQRITRAKRRLTEAGADFPRPADAAERMGSVLDVLYVTLTEAHHTTTGDPARDPGLAAEGVRLTRLLRGAVPDDTEVAGLLALMLLTEARHPARVGPRGELVPLDEQDRRLWDQDLVAEGLALLDGVVPGSSPGPYLLQACIAGVHAQARDTGSTDWDEIHALYRVLEHRTQGRNPTVVLNRIVAQAMVDGPRCALGELETLAAAHPDLPRAQSVRAHLLEREGRTNDAVRAYRDAARATLNVAEQRYLRERARRLVVDE